MIVADRDDHVDVEELHTEDVRALLNAGELDDWADSQLPVPTINDLATYVENSGQTTFWLLFSSKGKHVALLPFEVEKRSIHHFQAKSLSNAGYCFFDYLSFWCAEPWRPSVLDAVRRKAQSKGVDIVVLSHLLLPDASLANLISGVSQTQIFDMRRARHSWQDICSKRSLRQSHIKAQRNFDYRVEHHVADFDDFLLDKIAALHTERWRFDGIQSPLSELSRRRVYTTNRSLSVLTVLWAGPEILAAHYGLRFHRTIIFHTPVVNVKFLDHSPLQLLLFEVAHFCDRNGIEILDFGVGVEAYKLRFANDERRVSDTLLPTSWQGHVIVLIDRLSRMLRNSPLYLHLLPKIRGSRNRLARFRIRSRYYVGNVNANKEAVAMSTSDPRFLEIDNYPAFVDFVRNHAFELQRSQYDHFRRGSRFVCWIDQDGIVMHGWARGSGTFRVEETGEILALGEFELLHDLRSRKAAVDSIAFRAFINTFRAHHAGRRLLTYSLSDETFGRVSIEDAEFKPVPHNSLRELGVLS